MYYTNPINVIVSYIILISYSNIHGNALSSSTNATVPALFVFGDSILDTGNNNYISTIGKANFPPYGRDFNGSVATGRYSNGKVPSDLIAEIMGIKEYLPAYLDPTLQIDDLLTGVSFASGGSGYDPETARIGKVIHLDGQLKMFKEYIDKLKAAVGDDATSVIISQSLYIVCAGSNDITNTFFTLPFRRFDFDISCYTNLMVNWASSFVQDLYKLGARKIGVTGTPPSGCTPLQRTLYGGPSRKCAEDENQACILYNTKLSSELQSLNQKLEGLNAAYLDLYSPILDLVTNPSQAGFEVADRGCCGTGHFEVIFLCMKYSLGGTCKDASKYIFWDSFHPTETAYRFILQHLNFFF